MRALTDVRELLWVAEQDDAACALRDGDRVGERDLSGLVDEEDLGCLVHLRPGPEPSGAGVEEHPSFSVLVVRRLARAGDPVARIVVVALLRRLLPAAEVEPLLAGAVLDLPQEVRNCLVRGRGDAHPLAVAHQIDREARARPRLSRPGRTADHPVVSRPDGAVDSLDGGCFKDAGGRD